MGGGSSAAGLFGGTTGPVAPPAEHTQRTTKATVDNGEQVVSLEVERWVASSTPAGTPPSELFNVGCDCGSHPLSLSVGVLDGVSVAAALIADGWATGLGAHERASVAPA